MTENLVLVDGDDRPVGYAEKRLCHASRGMLHRAFTALLFDDAGRLLLTRRSPDKMLWPGKWDGTVASHPRDGETFVSAAERRLPEELGVSCTLEYLFKFEYHVSDGHRGSENEVCGTLIGTITSAPDPDPAEIVQTKFVSPHQMNVADSMEYCPWMLLALALLPRAHMSGSYHISEWTSSRTSDTMLQMTGRHMSDDDWRLVP